MIKGTQRNEVTVYNGAKGMVPEGAEAFDRGLNHAWKAQAILSVAAQEFVERGFNRVSLADIAARLKISKPMLYYYVGSKEEILFKCQLAAIDHLKEELEKVTSQNLLGIDALTQFMLRVGEWIESEFARCIARCHVDLLDPKARDEILAGRSLLDRSLYVISSNAAFVTARSGHATHKLPLPHFLDRLTGWHTGTIRSAQQDPPVI